MRGILLGLAFLIGCETAPATRERSPLEPHATGATIYVIDATNDFLDAMDTGSPSDSAATARWIGQQRLQTVLRAVSKGTQARLVSARHFELNQCEENELPPDQPVHYFERESDGRFALRASPAQAGFALKLRAARIEEAKYVHLEYAVSLFWAEHRKLPGTSLEAGKPTIRELPIDSAVPRVPIGAALWIPCPREGDRVYLILLHIASVNPA